MNELRLKRISSLYDTKKLMYDNFGKWDKEVWPVNSRFPVFIWENRKLLNTDALFSIAATGQENKQTYYASVIVYDDKNNDCFTEHSDFREPLIRYFLHGIKNLDSNKSYAPVLKQTARTKID